MSTLRRVDARELADLREEYTRRLTAPLDGMWETFASFAAHLEILHAGERIGYVSVDEQRRILQFALSPPFEDRSPELFGRAVRECDARTALVSTFEPWLVLCLDRQRSVRVHTLLYHDQRRTHVPLEGFDDVAFELVGEPGRTAIEDFVRRCLSEDPGDWLTGYLERLVVRKELWALRSGETLLGTGELRVSDSQAPYADLGVIVSPEHRGRGLASHILCRLKELSYGSELVPICSTTIGNRPAQRAIDKAGFVARHRLVEVSF